MNKYNSGDKPAALEYAAKASELAQDLKKVPGVLALIGQAQRIMQKAQE
jgi:hypothetical protein